MNIAHHLSQLLYRYQCVSVPGFGAFLTENVSANIQESNQTFYPPRKVISFNAHLKNNDGFLANHISNSEKLTYDNALLAIEREVKTWNSILQNNESLLLKNIGDLRQNSEGNLVFSPSNHLNYATDSFGLSSFVSPVVKREQYKELVQEFGAIETSLPVVNEVEIEYENRRYINPYLKYAAIFALSLGGLGIGYSSYISQTEKAETLLVQAEVQKEVEAKIQEATFFISTPIVDVTNNAPAEKIVSFHIMAGSFRNKRNAKKECQNLISKGFEATILSKNSNGLYPVAYGSYSTHTEAEYNLNQIKEKSNKDAWLLIEEE
ncbi:SPOR domain-containing protein [Flavobacterium sp.]|uniref:HU domain-containing protein n=1 Tax=Flavobacterium sp. TaxID=239 RepID=UPI00286E6D8F|nr:SPOR domain-containing protein [Flavobacterium sp.]